MKLGDKAANTKKLLRIATPEGKVYVFRKLSTKPLDPKLKSEGKVRARVVRDRFQSAVKKASTQGVPLRKVIPVI